MRIFYEISQASQDLSRAVVFLRGVRESRRRKKDLLKTTEQEWISATARLNMLVSFLSLYSSFLLLNSLLFFLFVCLYFVVFDRNKSNLF